MDRGLLWWALKSRWSRGDDGTYFAQYSIVGNVGMFSCFFFFTFYFPFPFLSLIKFVYCLLSRRRHTVSSTYLLHYTVPIVEGCQLPNVL